MAKEPTLPPSKRQTGTKYLGKGVSKPLTSVKPKPPPKKPG